MSITDTFVEGVAGDPGDVPAPRAIPVQRGRADRLFRHGSRTVGLSTLVVLFLIGLFLLLKGFGAFRYEGFRFFTTAGFQTERSGRIAPSFGVRAALTGTVVVALIALVLAVPVSLASSLFINEYAPRRLRSGAIAVVDLLAAVPSVIYGLWGFLFLSPHMLGLSRWLSDHLGFLPFFRVSTPLYTSSQFITGTVVALMAVPIITSILREVFSLVPVAEREGAMALGASRATIIRRVVLPFGRGGFVGAVMLGLGRAMGETIAVAIILSLSFTNPYHILQSGGSTIASLIAIRFDTGGKEFGLSSLMAIGFVLFVFTLAVNLAASRIVNRSRSGAGVEL